VLDRAGIGATFFVPVDAIDGGGLLWHDRFGYAAYRLLRTDRERALSVLGGGAAPGAGDQAIAHAAIQRAKRLAPADRLLEVARVEEAAGGAARPAWDGMMSWDQVRRLARDGHEIGSHSMSHPILPLLDDAALEVEVAGSRLRLEAELPAPCESFCYPNGSLDARVVEAVRSAGYRRAVTTAPGPNLPGRDPFQLTRSELQGRHAGSGALAAYQLSSLPARRAR
jgi:peptidoglycan/xylan/chitin deacetylase (PgdA/CDA1 family)